MDSALSETVQMRAIRLLTQIRDATEETGTPVFTDGLAAKIGASTEQARAAFRYLADHHLIETFSIPFTGRINARGQDELARYVLPPTTATATLVTQEWDAFLSHAGEDKSEIAIPLAEALRIRGIRVWLDSLTMTVGDSLSRSIDAGLSKSRFGIVVLSPDFFAKEWPRRELDGLVAREVAGQKVILPVWHRIDKVGVLRFSPTLADRVAAQSSKGIDAVADALVAAIRKGGQTLTGGGGGTAPVKSELLPANNPQSSQAQKGEDFHKHRVADIVAGKSPVTLMDQALLILHVIPHESVLGRSSPKFEAASGEPKSFLPIGSKMLTDSRISADGLIVGSNHRGLQQDQRAYSFVLRSGAVESVCSSILRGHKGNMLPLPWFLTVITDHILQLLKALNDLGFAPPYQVHVSLAGVGGVRLLQQWPEQAFPEDIPFGELGAGILYFDSATLDSLPSDRADCFRMLRPILLHLSNAANLQSPPDLI